MLTHFRSGEPGQMDVVVAGQIGRDLALLVDVPEGGSSAPVRSAADAVRVGRVLLRGGPRLVMLGAGDDGNIAVWPDGEVVLPLFDAPVVDPTGRVTRSPPRSSRPWTRGRKRRPGGVPRRRR